MQTKSKRTSGAVSKRKKDSDSDNESEVSSKNDESTKSSKKSKTDKKKSVATDKDEKDDEPNGFDKGYQPEKILGASDIGGTLMFLMQWKAQDKAELVVAKDANVKCPQLVIAFYEERLTWNSEDDK